MPKHLQKRRRRWYAVLAIPAALRPQFEGKPRFLKSLETTELPTAQRRLGPVIAGWRSELARAKPAAEATGSADDAAYFRRLLRGAATQAQREAILEQIGDAADALGYLHAEIGQPPASVPEAQEFVGRATGAFTPTLEHLEEWLTALHAKPRTKDQRRTGARRLAAAFPLLRDVTRPEVRKWAAGLALSRHSKMLLLGGMRVYWRWLQASQIVPEGDNPFEEINLVRAAPAPMRNPFTPAEVVRLRDAADPELADLIRLAMWTGCRIGELCTLKVSSIGPDSFRVTDAKTAAGVREVPIHAKLRPVLERLAAASSDGYVIAGQSQGKYGDRNTALGRRFSSLKTRLGFGEDQVFHSIRRCVVTQLENAGAAENVVASIVGHEVKTITYGLYSGGASLAVKAAALALLDYPG